MVLNAVPGWELDVDRGPDWLFVRLKPPQQGKMEEVDLAGAIWRMMDQSFTHRAVLEMNDVLLLRSWLIGELVKLHKRVAADGGMLRLAGLSNHNQEVLRLSRLDARFPQYDSRTAAVMGRQPLTVQ